MIEYSNLVETLTQKQFQGFFVGWSKPPTSEKLLELLVNSPHRIIALDAETGSVVGFVYAISDGVLSAYIPLIEVLPEYQHQGIGSELLRRILERLSNYYMVDLCCDEELAAFYRRFGMTQVAGMVRRNYSRQSGCDS